MIDEKLKEKIQKYLLNELSSEEETEILQMIEGSDELQDYVAVSNMAMDGLDDLPEIEPSANYMSTFWNKVEKEQKSKFNFFEFFNLKWSYVGSFAVFCLVSVLAFNIYFANNVSDEELLTELDTSLAVNTDSSLDVFGPWE